MFNNDDYDDDNDDYEDDDHGKDNNSCPRLFTNGLLFTHRPTVH